MGRLPRKVIHTDVIGSSGHPRVCGGDRGGEGLLQTDEGCLLVVTPRGGCEEGECAEKAKRQEEPRGNHLCSVGVGLFPL